MSFLENNFDDSKGEKNIASSSGWEITSKSLPRTISDQKVNIILM